MIAFAALGVRLSSPGPLFFRQERVGIDGRPFTMIKLRSMYVDAEERKAALLDRSDRDGLMFKMHDDPRVTPVGRVLRRFSIDELPQFFNALFGSLSLVGPRPHAVAAQSHNLLYNEVVDGYFARHKVKPGVTGWAQINGWRGEMDTNEKIRMRTEYDLYYIENWSMLFDLKILLLTPVRLLDTENAY